MGSIFTKIINQEIPSFKVAENENFYAFLDISPLEEGHVLVVPKLEIDYIFDLDDEMLANMNIFAKKVAIAIEKVIICKRIGIAVVGLEVPHAHIHLIPLHRDAIDFNKPRKSLSKEYLNDLANKIAAEVIL